MSKLLVRVLIMVTSVVDPLNLRADERGTPAEARTMLEKAVAHYKAVGRKQASPTSLAKSRHSLTVTCMCFA